MTSKHDHTSVKVTSKHHHTSVKVTALVTVLYGSDLNSQTRNTVLSTSPAFCKEINNTL